MLNRIRDRLTDAVIMSPCAIPGCRCPHIVGLDRCIHTPLLEENNIALNMADGTLQRLARTAGADQCSTFGDAAHGHIGDELRSWVTIFKLFEIFGHLNDPWTDGLLFTGFQGGEEHAGDKCLGNRIGFDNPDIRSRLERREIGCGSLHLGVRDVLR